MSQQITLKMLESVVHRINVKTKSPLTYAINIGSGIFCSNVGHYHLDGAYGGWKLSRVDNDKGGTRDISNGGYITKRELFNQLQIFLTAIEESS